MIVDLYTMIASMLCSYICWRLATFCPQGCRYRLGMSVCAYMLAVGTGGYAIDNFLSMLKGLPIDPVNPFLLIVFVILAVLVWQSRGNVAAVLRKKA
tara:strand:- start:146 stop:436 length:291 start_codon:yes stop_codon:yes gene_type:complete